MVINKEYYIGVYWGTRNESTKECAVKVKATFDFLSSIDESFRTWYKTSRPRKGEILQPIDISIKSIQTLLLNGQNHNDLGELLEELGYLIYLKSEKTYSKAHVLSITCGCYLDTIPNNVILNIGNNEAHEHLTSTETLEKIYKSLVNIWHPDKGVIKCNNEDLL